MVAPQDLVVVVPGILGSRLVRVEQGRRGIRTTVVWDLSIRHLPRLLASAVTGSLVLDESDDSVVADELFDFQLLPGFFGVDDYSSLVGYLRGLTSPEQVVTFPYDWRRSNAVAAERLATVVGDGLTRLREAGARDPKAWFICHSMGGLVARYYCEALGGAAHTRGIATIGTPHRGSVAALDALVNGKRLGPLNMTKVVRSFPSAYELLPLFPVVRTGAGADLRLLRLAETCGLDPVTGADVLAAPGDVVPEPVPHLDRARLQAALRFHAGIRVPAEARAPEAPVYDQRVILNRRQHTLHSVAVDGDRVDTFRTYPVHDGGRWREDDARGDGTVPAQSSVPIEWDDTTNAVTNAQKHAGIQGTQEAQTTIGNWLRPADARGFKSAPVADEDVVVLDVPPVVAAGQPVSVSVAAGRPTYATVEVTDLSSEVPGPPFTQPAPVTEEARPVVFEGLPPGLYRVTVVPQSPAHPRVSDYVLIDDPPG